MKVKINGEKLKREVLKTGRTLSEASLQIGYSSGVLSSVIYRGEMELRMAELLESIGIKKESFIEVEKEESEKRERYERYDYTDEERRLYKVVNQACYDAFLGALRRYLEVKV